MPSVSNQTPHPNCSSCAYGTKLRTVPNESTGTGRDELLPIGTEYLCGHPDEVIRADYNNRTMGMKFPCDDAKPF